MMIIALEEEAMGDQKRSDKWFASNYSIERDFSTYGLLIDVPRVCKWCNQTIITLLFHTNVILKLRLVERVSVRGQNVKWILYKFKKECVS